MKPFGWTTEQVLTATGGSLVSGSADMTFAGIGIDSRTIGPDDLFVAIAGETHDGHRFVADVLDRGVKGVVAGDDQVASLPMARMAAAQAACIAVADTTLALGAMARFNRNRGTLKVIAITGSNGKTSTRMLMEQVISRTFPTLSTSGNLNNHIGLPLTLFRLTPGHQAAVLELGMNHAGEITGLGRICEPDVGVITNVGPAHLEGLGTIENVARAKGELLHTIRPGGTAILNADDPRVAAMAHDLDRPAMLFGLAGAAQVRASDVRLTEAGIAFTLTTPSGSTAVTLATPARVMVSNALAAAAAGEVMGVALEHIQAGLETFCPQAGRMGIRRLGGDLHLVDDTYNANPASMVAAIETLALMHGNRRTIAVLGDMLELGPQSVNLHREIGRAAGDARLDRLYIAGNFAAAVADGAMDRQMKAEQIFYGTKAAIIDQLNHDLQAGDLILVKGSRGMAMEAVVEAIVSWANRKNEAQRRDTLR
ncbi:UDP-N-acetylmuramoyl-tripeptide--D-alanyl-D-alanine ligase [Desulfosarcina sp.]|uniref:UDP-N-acetylmuramoyl-tripeptide--D-alanyl-D- alanine ligase n=1 Tax=Desulfosarcina sp. TaxID=2027861 RepID=UPI0035695687